MGINLGDEFPNFEADTTEGKIKFHDWAGDSLVEILYFYIFNKIKFIILNF